MKIGVVNGKRRIVGSVRLGKDSCCGQITGRFRVMACFATVDTTSACRELFQGVTKCDQSFAELWKSLKPYAHLMRLETIK